MCSVRVTLPWPLLAENKRAIYDAYGRDGLRNGGQPTASGTGYSGVFGNSTARSLLITIISSCTHTMLSAGVYVV